jgi:hypothetical protein
LTITPAADQWGTSTITVTVSDTHGGTASQSFLLTVHPVNDAPVLGPTADQLLPASQDVLIVPLSATDVDGDALTFSAVAQSLAYVLNQQYGFFTDGNFYENLGGLGEKWVQGTGGTGWYFLLPNGELYAWDGGSGATGTLVGNVGASYWDDPYRLINAAADDPHAALTIMGSTLTISRDLAWVSSLVVTVTVSDGLASDTKMFTVTVAG